MSQIALVPHEHDHNVSICMVSELLQPPGHILVCLVLADIIHEQSAHGASVVRGCDSPITFLAGSVPDLGFDGFGIDLDGAGGKLNADSGLGI